MSVDAAQANDGKDFPMSADVDAEEDQMAAGALAAIRALLDEGNIPRGTFADDQVRNLVALYNQRGDEIERLRAENAGLRDEVVRLRADVDDLQKQNDCLWLAP